MRFSSLEPSKVFSHLPMFFFLWPLVFLCLFEVQMVTIVRSKRIHPGVPCLDVLVTCAILIGRLLHARHFDWLKEVTERPQADVPVTCAIMIGLQLFALRTIVVTTCQAATSKDTNSNDRKKETWANG